MKAGDGSLGGTDAEEGKKDLIDCVVNGMAVRLLADRRTEGHDSGCGMEPPGGEKREVSTGLGGCSAAVRVA